MKIYINCVQEFVIITGENTNKLLCLLFFLMLYCLFFSFSDKAVDIEKESRNVNVKPSVDVSLSDLKLVLGPELRILYPLILNFAVSGELELNGFAHAKSIKPKGTLTFDNGDVNLLATQVSSNL